MAHALIGCSCKAIAHFSTALSPPKNPNVKHAALINKPPKIRVRNRTGPPFRLIMTGSMDRLSRKCDHNLFFRAGLIERCSGIAEIVRVKVTVRRTSASGQFAMGMGKTSADVFFIHKRYSVLTMGTMASASDGFIPGY